LTDHDEPIGLPPRDDAPLPPPSPRALWAARCVNLFGLITPAANLGLFLVAPKARRWFGIGAGVFCTFAFAYAIWRETPWLAWTAAIVYWLLVVIGLLNPLWVAAIGGAWTAFGTALGKAMAYPVFVAVYLLVVTPTGLLVRAFGRDPLARKAPPAATYWTKHEPPGKEKYERQF
jgi:hypothetical protein